LQSFFLREAAVPCHIACACHILYNRRDNRHKPSVINSVASSKKSVSPLHVSTICFTACLNPSVQMSLNPCHESGGQLPVNNETPGSIQVQSLWDIWWREWHRDKFFYKYFFSPL
jgi:hypothetical protein